MNSGAAMRLARKIDEKIWPRRHGELRASVSWYVGVIFIGLGFFIALVQTANDRELSWGAVLGFIAVGAALISLRWSRTLHFRRRGVFVYRFGRYSRYEPYSRWTRVQLGPIFVPLQVIRHDGTRWNLPNPDDDQSEIRGEILWQLERAGVPIPDQVARQNRMGINELNSYSRFLHKRDQEPSRRILPPSG